MAICCFVVRPQIIMGKHWIPVETLLQTCSVYTLDCMEARDCMNSLSIHASRDTVASSHFGDGSLDCKD